MRVEVVLLAGFSPLLQTIGLFIWADRWKYSAVGLNATKGLVASVFFIVIVACTSRFKTFETSTVLWLALSSVLGIVIADTWWIIALARLGATRMIAVDTLKPFVAVLLGAAVLHDDVPLVGYAGVVATTAGVYLLSRDRTTEKEPPHRDDDDDHNNQDAASVPHCDADCDDDGDDDDTIAVPTAALTPTAVVVAAAAVARRDSGEEDEDDAPTKTTVVVKTVSPRETGDDATLLEDDAPPPRQQRRRELIGYSFATANVILDVYAAAVTVAKHGRMSSADVNLVRFGFAGIVLSAALTPGIVIRRCRSATSAKTQDKPGEPSSAIIMTRGDWVAVLVGVVFVTVLSPLINVYCLFRLPLAIVVTLGSIAPIWSLPVAFFYSREPITIAALCGAALSSGGVSLLCLAALS